ncbi:UDP-glucose:glycoprotein glucosyltransferase 2 [Chelonia mydas]|uniref:UDP-glucose:glycoprotein glucosyltransferase 2 n=1 Tax=Chelonia mydas TaxID=8469 RepID=M7B2P1_CHEMY|nr:UDP-glucose:glycoprotein glucosyltransferase 2 [Chelonia mydas]
MAAALLLLLCVWPLRCGAPASPKAVTARLAAKWPATSLLLEASEFIAEEDNEKFWQFLETVRELTIYKQRDSEHSYYNLILKKAGQFLSNLQINLLKFALSIRAYSPTVQMFQQPRQQRSGLLLLLGSVAGSGMLNENVPVFILYAEIGTKDFVKFHTVLSEKVQKEEIVYILRHYVQGLPFEGSALFSYQTGSKLHGLTDSSSTVKFLATNDTTEEEDDEAGEVQGFLFGKLKQMYPDLKDNLKDFRKHLIESTNNLEPLKVWELQDLSFQAASQIISTPVYSALKVMKDIAQNFPIKARCLWSLRSTYYRGPCPRRHLMHFGHVVGTSQDVPVNAVLQIQACGTQHCAFSNVQYGVIFSLCDLGPCGSEHGLGGTAGGQHPEEDAARERSNAGPDANSRRKTDGTSPMEGAPHGLSILETLKLEGKVLHGLHDLGIKEEAFSKFMRLQIHPVDDSCALDIRHSSIIWVNNIEKDHIYNKWTTSFQELLKQTYPGVIRQIRRNLYNLVLFIDPVQEHAADFVKQAELFYHHNIPLRIGFVFILNTNEEIDGNEDAGVALLRAFNYVAEESDTSQAFISMINMYHEMKDGEVFTVNHVRNVLRSEFPHADIQSILGVDSEYDEKRKAGVAFYKKTGLGPLPQALFNGVPFNGEEMAAAELDTVILQRITDAMGFFQRAVFMGLLSDHMDAVDFLMDQHNIVSRINPTILGTKRRYINFISTSVPVGVEDFSTFSFLDSQDKSAVISENMKYLTKKDEDVIYAVTIWIIADFDKPSGRHLLSKALKHLKTSSHTRLGIVNNPISKITEDNTAIARAILTAFLTQKNSSLKSFLSKIAKEETAKALARGTKIKKLLVPGMDDSTFEKKYNTIGMDIIQTHQMFCQEVLKLLPGQMAVVSNGRVLGPLDENEFFTEDFHLLEKITFSTSAEKIKSIVREMGISSKHGSDLIMKVDALLSSLPKTVIRQNVEFLKEQHSIVRGRKAAPAASCKYLSPVSKPENLRWHSILPWDCRMCSITRTGYAPGST